MSQLLRWLACLEKLNHLQDLMSKQIIEEAICPGYDDITVLDI